VDKLRSLFRHLGNSLDLDDTLATLDCELRHVVRYDGISVHLLESDKWVEAYAAGTEGEHTLETPLPAAMIQLYRTGEGGFAQQDSDLVREASEKINAAISNARKYRDAVRVAEMDPATGLLNGRGLFGRLDAELARARRSQTALAVLQCRLEGAADIAAIAAGLKECCREYDFVACSGEDFVLVLSGCSTAEGGRMRERVAQIVAAAGARAHFGAAFFPDDGADAEDLLTAAAVGLHAHV
jgi:GGDEF domain-containing protein